MSACEKRDLYERKVQLFCLLRQCCSRFSVYSMSCFCDADEKDVPAVSEMYAEGKSIRWDHVI
jgi:hypothetical protein